MLRASEAERWVNCPGSTVLARIAKPESQESREGDLCHLLTMLMGRGDIRPGDSIEEINTNPVLTGMNKTGLLVTEDYKDLAMTASAYCNSLRGAWVVYEQYVSGGDLPENVEGTLDFATYDEEAKALHIVDLKFGFSVVEAVRNWQLVTYATGIIGAVPSLKGANTVHLHICQPRDYISGAFKVWVVPMEAWASWVTALNAAAEQAKTGSPAQTGPHCKYCPSRVFCKPFLESASTALETVQVSPENTTMTPYSLGAELSYLYRAEALVVSARKAFEDLAIAEIEAGRPIQGWQIGRTGGKRYWSAEHDQIKAVAAMTGVSLFEEKPISITAALKNRAARPALETLISKSEGSKKLVPFDGTKVQEILK